MTASLADKATAEGDPLRRVAEATAPVRLKAVIGWMGLGDVGGI